MIVSTPQPMQCAISQHEDARVASLHSYNILDTPPEQAFDLITKLTQMALDIPTVLVSLVDRDRQWFKAKRGFEPKQTTREGSFCTHAVQQDRPFIVSDATVHPLFQDSPMVTGAPHIRFYIGIPLKMKDGAVIGTLCAIDYRPRALSTAEIDIMSDLAGMVVREIELRQMAVTDVLTGALTRRGFETEAGRELARAQRSGRAFSMIVADIDHFKSFNDRHGHACGDTVLRVIVDAIKLELRPTDSLARIGGEEFVVILPETDRDEAHSIAERVRGRIKATTVEADGQLLHVTSSFGIASYDGVAGHWSQALENADAALYQAKALGRDRCVTWIEPVAGPIAGPVAA